MSVRTQFFDIIDQASWLQRTLLIGAACSILWTVWTVPSTALTQRVFRDALLFICIPVALAITHGRKLGYRIDRTAIRDTIVLAAFVLPFYLVGSSLPSIREYYPMWSTTLAFGAFLPHAIQQLIIVIAAETYYRGLLCVGISDEIGRISIFISPIIYAFHHVGKPPIELLLSGPTDVLFGAVDYHAQSLLPSIVAHGLGLVLLDWLVLHEPVFPPELVMKSLRWIPVPL
ncbi:MAG: CAAX amino terminal protease family [Haloquadratum walsbyi J07HQW2]|uniref:CAAX amino terminal protease family n=1 Tax=Haloquadratum walsbyi J07HQW2 TaxID=1238425 RepID=U1PRM2_9EURY|nr:MAG: CAAX amino terminal protease family [Haloquadratum walsbyi J07HQW2]